ncbi:MULTISPECIES: HDOD domain-containing protein [unclassified Shewanella]|uniref:HDOD domain-containing protein n=1 Tax=unclassified Shewanella TaxID=196818 RepID=UPI000C85AABC|nr:MULTISPECIES: HDOD domain-containing protein [unclassified Shewanella]MDO6618052.1 HDOD domain-containing protein [Shewanella sp. 6_MG-2023]MDO6679211.1 HDOD domain-containing protein [Shewanella sp. 4_MG-2023]PMG30698.1 histidine kinase [Shewanella sp. 10N.286.52.C2]PMG43615.1 histidine kinase [Shewanella sp. 10N.286.52.B9]PMH85374.1 histidine kinase [Shewanella sp. 10N.286.48.B5]
MAVSVAGGVRPGKVIEVERRLYKQLIMGKEKLPSQLDDLDKQLEDDANKLEVERLAIKARLEEQARAQLVLQRISEQLTNTVISSLEHQLNSPQQMLAQSGLKESHILLLDLLLNKEPDLRRVRSLVENISWLSTDLINLINSPASSHRRPQRSEVKVTDIKLVLNYIGIENLQAVIPYFCLRHWLPSGNTNLIWASRKLWRYSMITAIAAKALAALHQKDVALVYSAALMKQLGAATILNASARQFENTWGTWLRETSAKGDKTLYDAVMASAFPAEEVFEQVMSYGEQLNWQLLDLMDFNQSQLTQVLKELDLNYHFSEFSTESAIVAKASCYAKVLILEQSRLIEPQEKRVLFDYYEFTEQELIRLKSQNYRKLNLV